MKSWCRSSWQDEVPVYQHGVSATGLGNEFLVQQQGCGLPFPYRYQEAPVQLALPWSTLAAVAPWNLNGQETINYLLLPVTQIKSIKAQTLLAHKFSILESDWRLFRWMLLGKFSKLCLKGWSRKQSRFWIFKFQIIQLNKLFVRKFCVYTSHSHCFELDLLMSVGDTKPKVLLWFHKEEEGPDLHQFLCRNRTTSLCITFYKITLGTGAVFWAATIP